MLVKVNVRNMPCNRIHGEEWIVARPNNTDLWYYGAYTSEQRAVEVAQEVEGVVLHSIGQTIPEILQRTVETMCHDFCQYPNMPIPEGKTEDWLCEEGGPCFDCPFNDLM